MYLTKASRAESGAIIKGGERERTHSRLLLVVYSLLIFVMPFTAAFVGERAIPFAGELNTEPYLLATSLLSPVILVEVLLRREFILPKSIMRFAAAFSVVLALGFISNSPSILEGVERGRSAVGKFAVSAAVVYGGIFFAMLTFNIAIKDLRGGFFRPLSVATLVLVVGGVIEVLSWKSQLFEQIYKMIPLVVHDEGFGSIAEGLNRVRSVTFEASSFGGISLFIIPWLLLWFSEANSVAKRLLWGAVIVAEVVLCLLSGRTAFVGGVGIGAIYAGVSVFIGYRSATSKGAYVFFCGAFVAAFIVPLIIFLFFADDIGVRLAQRGEISYISRFGTVSILIDLFKGAPLFGVGMGQYGFYVRDMVPAWAYTYEFARWINDPSSSFFPSFSGVARIAGELGLSGLAVWTCFSASLLLKVYKAALSARQKLGLTPKVGIAIVVSFFGMALFEWTAGGLKGINIWGTFGLAAAYICQPLALERSARNARVI